MAEKVKTKDLAAMMRMLKDPFVNKQLVRHARKKSKTIGASKATKPCPGKLKRKNRIRNRIAKRSRQVNRRAA